MVAVIVITGNLSREGLGLGTDIGTLINEFDHMYCL